MQNQPRIRQRLHLFLYTIQYSKASPRPIVEAAEQPSFGLFSLLCFGCPVHVLYWSKVQWLDMSLEGL